ncbi:MAG: efflux RND transporter periplasmic adaptor subunit [Pedosphaera sp.]|nr:efflux RND transporter periplasmic adaptor subunit [Pedosphaera sp.]
MNPDQLSQLKIDPAQRKRSSGALWLLFLLVAIITAVAFWRAAPRSSDSVRIAATSRDAAIARADKELVERKNAAPDSTRASTISAETDRNKPANSSASSQTPHVLTGTEGRVVGAILTVSGYIVNRERIELSPRFMGVVKWIGVRKGDSVTNGQVVVMLDDAEYRARLAEIDGQIGVANVAIERAQIDFKRIRELVAQKVEMQKMFDDARLQLASTEAQVKQLLGSRKVVETWLDWCVIRSPVNGVVLERMVDPSELVTPQAFGSGRGPSTSLLAVADPKDLQVEIDLNESDLAKVAPGQKCKVSPEAFPNKTYDGIVAEMAPEASRQKGTLQIKVQILNPDQFLTPELSAKVDFLPQR